MNNMLAGLRNGCDQSRLSNTCAIFQLADISRRGLYRGGEHTIWARHQNLELSQRFSRGRKGSPPRNHQAGHDKLRRMTSCEIPHSMRIKADVALVRADEAQRRADSAGGHGVDRGTQWRRGRADDRLRACSSQIHRRHGPREIVRSLAARLR